MTEPPSMPRPINLIASWEGRTYRVEVKRLASSEHDEFHSKAMKTLNRALETQEQQMIISLEGWPKTSIVLFRNHVEFRVL